MTRFPKLWALLVGRQPDSSANRLKAREAYEDAVRRGDTRAQHLAWEVLKAATNAELQNG